MQVSYRSERTDLDQPAREAAADRAGKPIRLRVQPTLLRRDSNYVAWPNVSWGVECENAEELIALRKAMEAFFHAIARHGVTSVIAALTVKPTVG